MRKSPIIHRSSTKIVDRESGTSENMHCCICNPVFAANLALNPYAERDSIICTRLHGLVPEFNDSADATRFFTNPVITAFVDLRGFRDTVEGFNWVNDLEEGPG